MIVPSLFSVNPLINPRGTCFFRASDLWVKGLDIKIRTAWESGGSGAAVEWALKEILLTLLWFPLRLCSAHEDCNVSEH